MIRRAWPLQLLASIPTLLTAQSVTMPTSGAELAGANRATWVAALAAACDSIPMDSTWRGYRVPDSEVTIRLPAAFAHRGDILRGFWYDAGPGVPARDYALEHFDPISSRLILQHATFSFRCPGAERRPAESLSSIWIAGFDDRSREDPEEGVWYVLGSWHSGEQWLYGMSRDLWGARALVAGMRSTEFPRKQGVERPR